MPRLSRETSPTGVYHVMLRGINRSPIFADEDDCRKFVKILRQITHPKDADNKPLPPYCNIHAYCLMTNHIHLLIAEGAEPLANTMKRIGVAYVTQRDGSFDGVSIYYIDKQCYTHCLKSIIFIHFSYFHAK